MPDISVSITQGNTISVGGGSSNFATITKRQKFSRTAGAGYTTLTANQLAGVDAITLDFRFKPNSLILVRNGILMESTAEYTEAVARTGFTLVGTYDDTDKFEAIYVKS